jgi:hypothetical protein
MIRETQADTRALLDRMDQRADARHRDGTKRFKRCGVREARETKQTLSLFLFGVSIVMVLIGASVFASAKRAIHEIEAGICVLTAAVLLSGAAIVDAIHGAAEVKTPGGNV